MSPRPGIYKQWSTLATVKKDLQKVILISKDSYVKFGHDVLTEYYILTGERHPDYPWPPFLLKNPPPPWRNPIGDMCSRGMSLATEGFLQLLDGKIEGWSLVSRGITAAYLLIYSGFLASALDQKRNPTSDTYGAPLGAVFDITGIAFVVGHRREAERQARMSVEAYRQGHYDSHTFPIYHLLLRVWADWLDIEPPEWGRGAEQEPILNEWFAHWREPDPQVLAPYLINACDFHTQRCRLTKNGANDWYEFEPRKYHRFPVEILVIFRIRHWLGLANPKLDHPLMDSLLGELPPEMEPEMDDLTRRVHERARSQGFDEDEIYRMYCGV